MARISAFRGTWSPNKRPYVVVAPDAYVAIQGETTAIVCGNCRREVNLNKYLTGISTEASVDSPPGSATVNLSIPDNDVNDFFMEGEFLIQPMMEIEIFAKGYFTVGGYPQYYKIFWGLVSSITKNWSNGVTTFTLSCKDILRWWELTNVILNPGFIAGEGSSAGNFVMFANQFAGQNPYSVIIGLAKDSMGDLSLTTGSFLSYKPELGAEKQSVGRYAKDVMAYWQLKFANIWNNLVLYGSTGVAYTFSGNAANVTPQDLSQIIWRAEADRLALNTETTAFKIQPHEIAAFKVELARAVDFDLFQSESRTKLSVALTARDQILYEFYCDTTGDIVFKPPFYNMNVIPNKPVSWVQDFEIIDDSITETEQEVFTHITSAGNAFGGVMDYGLSDDITTPRTGVVDFHLLRKYGWRRMDYQCEWAGNPKKLFYFLMDYLDRVNAKRTNGTVTIPMRPELRMGFPVWIPRYDSFFYVNGISHNYSPGGQATTTLTLTAKRSKFIAPSNIGRIEEGKGKSVQTDVRGAEGEFKRKNVSTYTVDFPSAVGGTIGVSSELNQGDDEPAVMRDPRTGKILGFPNVVMVFRRTKSDKTIAKLLGERGASRSSKSSQQNKQRGQNKKGASDPKYHYNRVVADTLKELNSTRRSELIARLRNYRYEAGYTTAGLYDYAEDTTKTFKEMAIIPADHILWGNGCDDPSDWQGAIEAPKTSKNRRHAKGKQTAEQKEEDPILARDAARKEDIQRQIKEKQELLAFYKKEIRDKKNLVSRRQRDFNAHLRKKYRGKKVSKNEYDDDDKRMQALVDQAKSEWERAKESYASIEYDIKVLKNSIGLLRRLTKINIMVRPVSDEYGFELIGHQRYGRGVFIDRGQMRITDPSTGRVANELGIQFAATGGLLTDSPNSDKQGMTLESEDFAQAYEKMQPDEYVTGASARFISGRIDSVNPTSQRTYTDAINHQIADTGKAVYAEVDALRRSVTLAELRPTLKSGLDAVGWDDCSCTLSKTNWLSVLPKTFLEKILGPQTFESSPVTYVQVNEKVRDVYVDPITNKETYEAVTMKPGSNGVAIPQANIWDGSEFKDAETGEITREGATVRTRNETVTVVEGDDALIQGPSTFFQVLNTYLQQLFETSFLQNMERERYATEGDVKQPPVYSGGPEQDNILQPPGGGSLFDRAAAGDADALKALQEDAEFNFGRTKQAAKQLDEAWSEFKKSEGVKNLGGLGGQIWDAAKGGLVDPGISASTGKEEQEAQDAIAEQQKQQEGKMLPGAPNVQYQPPAPRPPEDPAEVDPNLEDTTVEEDHREPRDSFGAFIQNRTFVEPPKAPLIINITPGDSEDS